MTSHIKIGIDNIIADKLVTPTTEAIFKREVLFFIFLSSFLAEV
jgi:hypothetical protein